MNRYDIAIGKKPDDLFQIKEEVKEIEADQRRLIKRITAFQKQPINKG